MRPYGAAVESALVDVAVDAFWLGDAVPYQVEPYLAAQTHPGSTNWVNSRGVRSQQFAE